MANKLNPEDLYKAILTNTGAKSQVWTIEEFKYLN